MGLPGHRRTSSDKRRRAAHFALGKISLSVCPKCSKPVLPHRMCQACGFYRGREVVNTTREVTRLMKKTSASAKASPDKQAPAAPAHDHDHANHDHTKDKSGKAGSGSAGK